MDGHYGRRGELKILPRMMAVLALERAKTSRSTCRATGESIPKDTWRVVCLPMSYLAPLVYHVCEASSDRVSYVKRQGSDAGSPCWVSWISLPNSSSDLTLCAGVWHVLPVSKENLRVSVCLNTESFEQR